MRKKSGRIVSSLISIMLVLCALPASALSADISSKYNETAEHLYENFSPQVGSIGGEWAVIGLARSGRLNNEQKQAYYEAVKSYVEANSSAKLNKRKSSDNSRVVLALSAIGENAENIGGYDLVEPLTDFNYVKKQGINGVIWALIALDSCNYYTPNSIRDELINEICSSQHPDGSWGLDETADPDVTGMAVQAIAPYKKYDERIQKAVDNAFTWIHNLKKISLSPESCAQLIVAAANNDITPDTDESFSAVIDCLMRYSVEKGFSHTLNGEYNQMATEQAFYALTACERRTQGQPALYDMTDISNFEVLDFDNDGIESINDVTIIQRYVAEFAVDFSTSQKKLADLSKNGRIDIGDVTMYQQRLAQ